MTRYLNERRNLYEDWSVAMTNCEHQWTICWDSFSVRNEDGSLTSPDLVCIYCGKLQKEAEQEETQETQNERGRLGQDC